MRTIWILLICLSVSSCAHFKPRYKTGDMVISKVSGARGQIVDWWCRSRPCQYTVRFSLHPDGSAERRFNLRRLRFEDEMFHDETMSEHELELADE